MLRETETKVNHKNELVMLYIIEYTAQSSRKAPYLLFHLCLGVCLCVLGSGLLQQKTGMDFGGDHIKTWQAGIFNISTHDLKLPIMFQIDRIVWLSALVCFFLCLPLSPFSVSLSQTPPHTHTLQNVTCSAHIQLLLCVFQGLSV